MPRPSSGDITFSALPAIAVEVRSPSNWAGEIHRKARDYARAGVPEMWGAHQVEGVITSYSDIVDGDYTRIVDHGPTSTLSSVLPPAFSVAVGPLFSP